MALSANEYTYTGGAQTFPVNFELGFIDREDIFVRINEAVDGGGEPVFASFTWIDDSNITVDDPLVNGDIVQIRRIVSKTELQVDFEDNADVTAKNLNGQTLQSLMIYQELLDGFVGFSSPADDADRAEAAALAAETARDEAEAAAASTDADVIATAADRVATGQDATATAADRVQTGADVLAAATSASNAAASNSAAQGAAAAASADADQTALDLIATGNNVALTDADRIAAAASAAAAAASADSAQMADFEDFRVNGGTFLSTTTVGGTVIMKPSISGLVGDSARAAIELPDFRPGIWFNDLSASSDGTMLQSESGRVHFYAIPFGGGAGTLAALVEGPGENLATADSLVTRAKGDSRFARKDAVNTFTEGQVIEKQNDVSLTIRSTGGGTDDDAFLFLDAYGDGEAVVEFKNQNVSKATIEWFETDNQMNISTKTAGSFVDVQPNDKLTMRVLDNASPGRLVSFYESGGASVGHVGHQDTDIWIGEGQVCLQFQLTGTDRIDPFDGDANAVRDNAIDLGGASSRFDDIYATNGTIQTSDINEKQDIAELDEAEHRVAVACKGLLRKYRWKKSVAEKGDAARIHFGIMAQELQAAFAAEGLDAGDYAMFTSTTWWDEVLPDDGGIRKHWSEEEAPEGATKHTRLGVRYPELLAFIIAAI